MNKYFLASDFKDALEFDVIVVGAGVAGLCLAIKLKQLNAGISIAVVEKAGEIGGHILSGNVFETKALDELIPNWQNLQSPIKQAAKEDNFIFLSKNKHFKLPTPKQMNNRGNYIISLANLCRWLAQKATELGVEIFPGFPARHVLYSDDLARVEGILINEFGVDKQGNKKANYQPPVAIKAKYTVLAEGCRGSLTKQLEQKFSLRDKDNFQTYAIGFKELWKVENKEYSAGKIIHTIGFPLDKSTYGGSFLYHMENGFISIGYVVGLDYKNPHLSPFNEFQRFKTHPFIAKFLENGTRVAYGARALNEGGFQSIPKLEFEGGAIIGCAAGFMNVPKIKGSHTAMKSGMILAETIAKNFSENKFYSTFGYEDSLKKSWVYKELKAVRNIRPSFKFGLYFGLLYSAIDTYIFRGKAPFTFRHKKDNESLKKANNINPIDYPKPDGRLSFDILSSVYLSNTNHEENQPCHLQLKDPNIAIEHNYKLYSSPETRYCPAKVYEIINVDTNPKLQINAQNCIHCKTCDIKDPLQNINWVTPEGGGGPNYGEM